MAEDLGFTGAAIEGPTGLFGSIARFKDTEGNTVALHSGTE